jgi:hypothetical protein
MKKWYLVHTGQYAFVTNKKMCDPNVVAVPITAEVAARVMLLEKTANTKDTGQTIDEEEGV